MGFVTKLSVIVLLVAVAIGVAYWYIRLPGVNGLGFTTTPHDVLRRFNAESILAGKNIVVTGGHTGIGVPTVASLAKYHPYIWMLARANRMGKCEEEARIIRSESGNNNVVCSEVDLTSFRSVKAFADKWKEKNEPIHILILNAGVGTSPYSETEDGFETIFQTNHLSHFLLTNLLMDNLKLGAPSRVVVVSSTTHSQVYFDDITGKNTWYNGTNFFAEYFGPIEGYQQSKSANILFALKLNEFMKGFGNSNSLHPGIIKTEINRNFPDFWLFRFFPLIFKFSGKTPEQGAATQVYVATAPELEGVGGKFFIDCNEALPNSFSSSFDNAERLWKLSEQMVAKYLQ